MVRAPLRFVLNRSSRLLCVPKPYFKQILNWQSLAAVRAIVETADSQKAGYGISPVADVRYASKNWHRAGRRSGPLCAISGPMHCSKQNLYSITSLAVASSDGGMVMPSALAVLRLITSSNFVVSWTGRSPGFSPLSMRSTYVAPWRSSSSRL